jgi:hypothetical protein
MIPLQKRGSGLLWVACAGLTAILAPDHPILSLFCHIPHSLKTTTMKKSLLLISFLLLCSFARLRAGDNPIGSLSGTYTVGNSQPTYKKLTDVANVLNSGGFTVVGNVVFELDSDYDGTTGEIFPITFNQFNSNGNWTVTMRPKAGVSLRTTSGNPGTGALITLNGADRLILDGRAGGTGGIGWLIRNTATTNAGATILLQNDAQNNILTYLQLEGQTTSAGIVHIAASGTEGNDNNTISYCAIRDRSDLSNPVMPVTGILSEGSGATNGTVIDHNNIFNFYNSGGSAYGIRLTQGTRNASITHNSVYQARTIVHMSAGVAVYGIFAGDTVNAHVNIADNFIGGSAPQCGGAPLTVSSTGSAYCSFTGILFGVVNSSGDANTCDKNTIRNIGLVMATSPGQYPAMFKCIDVIGSKLDVTNNTVGNPDGHDDIKITMNGGTGGVWTAMIHFQSAAGGSVTGNKIGGITLGGTIDTDNPGTFYGINAQYSNNIGQQTFLLDNNTVGSTTIPDNIRVSADSLPMYFYGLYANPPGLIICTNNTVAGVDLRYSGRTARHGTRGIYISGLGTVSVKNNLVADISSASLTPCKDPNADMPGMPGMPSGPPAEPFFSFHGISVEARSTAEISGNTIRGLRLTGTAFMNASGTENTNIAGMYLEIVGGLVYNNRIYSFSSANNLGASSSTLLSGMEINRSWNNKITIYNNLISLDNGANTNNCEIRGIRFTGMDGSIGNVYHNTIYIGGNNGIPANNAVSVPFGIAKGNSSVFRLRNNLLVNGRTGGTGAHYVFRDSLVSPQVGWTTAVSDTNVLITTNLNKTARRIGADLDSAQWKTTGGDAHSWFYTVAQIAPANLFTDPAAGDLSIKAGSRWYVAGKGIASTGITTDYAGETRSTTAPTIGAYEYNPVNLAPVITSHGGNATVTLSVPENTTTATTVTATDDNTLVYSLAGGEDAGKFTVNSSTGELSFITAPDFEQPGDANGDNVYLVTVQVSDGDSTTTQRFKIKITDANDHAPVITSYNGEAAVTLRVPENTTAVIATVKVTDVDKNTTITYSLVNEEDAVKFTVNSSTGELSFLAAPDYEQPMDGDHDNVYVVTVKASDGDSTDTQRFKIKVQDVNDNAPVIISNDGKDTVTIQVAENTTVAVDTVTATDADAGSAIRYSIVNSGDGALFSVDPVAGVLRFIAPPDYEQLADGDHDNVYIVTVQASDGDSTDTQRFEIKVTNSNDSPLIITTTMQLPENTLAVTTLGAADDDAGVTISIEPGGDGALFSLDPATGVLSFIAAPDFEHPSDANNDNIYVVAIRMFDGTLATILKLNITITDADGSSARTTTGRNNTTDPEVQPAVVLQMESATEPGRGIKVYPNPVTGKRFTLRMDSIAAGRYTLELYTIAGQLVSRQSLDHTGKSVLYPIRLPATLVRGLYVLKLTGIDTRHTEKLIVE